MTRLQMLAVPPNDEASPGSRPSRTIRRSARRCPTGRLLLALLLLGPAGVYTSIDVPGAVGTRAFGVNVQGDVVGGWSTDPGCPDCFTHAFLRTRRGVIQELEFPGALETVANGINALGQVVGTYVAEDGTLHGFLRDDGDDN